MDSLDNLSKNVHQLVEQYQELQNQIQLLKDENIRQREEIMQSHAEIQQLKKEYHHLQVAHSLIANDEINNEERQKAKQRLSLIISQIDKTIEILKQ